MTGNDVKVLRKILNLSQSELADMINKQFSLQYKRENIEDWEHGNLHIRKDIFDFIASLYHKDILNIHCTNAQNLIPGDSLHVHNKEATSVHDQYFHYKLHEFDNNKSMSQCDLCDHYNLCDPTDRPCNSQNFNFYLKFDDLTNKIETDLEQANRLLDEAIQELEKYWYWGPDAFNKLHTVKLLLGKLK